MIIIPSIIIYLQSETLFLSHNPFNYISLFSPTSTKVRVGGPDGGEGGHGGSVIFKVDPSIKSLRPLRPRYRAGDGASGRSSYHTGKSGKNIVVKVRLWEL